MKFYLEERSYIYFLFILKLFGNRYRVLSQFGVIFISSVFHEHILSFAFGFFYPVMFILFAGFGCTLKKFLLDTMCTLFNFFFFIKSCVYFFQKETVLFGMYLYGLVFLQV